MGAGQGKARRAKANSPGDVTSLIPDPDELQNQDKWQEVKTYDLQGGSAWRLALSEEQFRDEVKARIKPGMILLRSSPVCGVILGVDEKGSLDIRFKDRKGMQLRWGTESFAIYAPTPEFVQLSSEDIDKVTF